MTNERKEEKVRKQKLLDPAGWEQQLDGQHSDQATLLFPSALPENPESQTGLSETHPHPLHIHTLCTQNQSEWPNPGAK